MFPRVNRGEAKLARGMANLQLPARIEEPPAFDPEFLRWFAPGERAIWWGRSRGLYVSAQQIAILAIYAAIAIPPLWVWLFIHETDQRVAKDVAFAGLACLWTIGLLHALWKHMTAPCRADAVLTDRRLYLRTGVFRRTIRRLGGPRDKLSRRIHMLRLIGPNKRPLLKLRGFMANETGIVLLRLDNPHTLADLIETTLAPDLELKDRTR